ncbi:hypothetical protein JDV02_001653 [Purpureocillium takamizusanense]|uniref:Uncharacterized protein n=1 Tax=Purpureocillium takamizusanense TaxID=2060973 RepID=A0A9Q8Q769_9HYPO|nr:uncharacterized protein JDV02_001653 [Purpureocillium takamizusanense]UNI15084.1 hypothetical protein JDV02_001653 [Purpureocillium takamizusanense]
MKSGFVALLATCLAGSGLSAPTPKSPSQLNQRDIAAPPEWAKQEDGSPIAARAAREGIDILTDTFFKLLHGHPENSHSKRQYYLDASFPEDSNELEDEGATDEENKGDEPPAGSLTDTVDKLTGGSGNGPAQRLTDIVDGMTEAQSEESADGRPDSIDALTAAIPSDHMRKTVENVLSTLSRRDRATDAGKPDQMLQRRIVEIPLGVIQRLAKGLGIPGGLGAGKRDVSNMEAPVNKSQLSGAGQSGNDAKGVPIVPLAGSSDDDADDMSGGPLAGSSNDNDRSRRPAGARGRPKDVAFPGGWPKNPIDIATDDLKGFPSNKPKPKPKKQDNPLGDGLLHGSVLPGVLVKREASEPETNTKLGLHDLLTMINKRGKPPPGGLQGVKDGRPDIGLTADLTGAIKGAKGKDAENFPGLMEPVKSLLGLGMEVPKLDNSYLKRMNGLNDAEQRNAVDKNPSDLMARRASSGAAPGGVSGLDATATNPKELPGIPPGLFGPSKHSENAAAEEDDDNLDDDSQIPAGNRESSLGGAPPRNSGSGVDKMKANLATPWRALKEPS